MAISLKGNDESTFLSDVDIGGGDIELNADGSATFAGGLINLQPDGYFLSERNNSNGTLPAFKVTGKVGGTQQGRLDFACNGELKILNESNDQNVTIRRDGSATFAGYVQSDLFSVSRSVVANKDNYESKLAVNDTGKHFNAKNAAGVSTASINADGSASFASGAISFASSGSSLYRAATGNGSTILNLKSNQNGIDSVAVTIRANGLIMSDVTTISPLNSESRLKENIVPINRDTAWQTIKSVDYYEYKYKISDGRHYGPMADEVPDEMRIATDQSDDVGVIHTYDNGMLQARLYTALQTALTRIEALEAEVQALKGEG